MISFIIWVLVLTLFAGIGLVAVAAAASTIFHVWGTSTWTEWLAEAAVRIFAGSLRRRLLRVVTRQYQVGVDKSRAAYPYLLVAISPSDAESIVEDGDLTALSAAATRAYVRHARAERWKMTREPQVLVVEDELLRPCCIKARPVSPEEFAALARELLPSVARRVVPSTANPGHQDLTSPLPEASLMATKVMDNADAVTEAASLSRIVLADENSVRHAVTAESVTIGRGNDCQIRLECNQVSREHVYLYRQGGQWWLRDQDSLNGTLVDGQQIRGRGPRALSRGSQITLGSAKGGARMLVTELAATS